MVEELGCHFACLAGPKAWDGLAGGDERVVVLGGFLMMGSALGDEWTRDLNVISHC